MITSVAGPVSTPVHVRPVPPAVEPVPAVAPVADQGRRAADQSALQEAGRATRAVTSPPEPVSTQSVLLLRQNGASIAGIAEAYGMSVEAIRRLLQAGREEESAPVVGTGGEAA